MLKFSERAMFVFTDKQTLHINMTDSENLACVCCSFKITVMITSTGTFFVDLREFLKTFKNAFKLWTEVVIDFKETNVNFLPAYGHINQAIHINCLKTDRQIYNIHGKQTSITSFTIDKSELVRIIDNGIVFLAPGSGTCTISSAQNKAEIKIEFPNESVGKCSIVISFNQQDKNTHYDHIGDACVKLFISYLKRLSRCLTCANSNVKTVNIAINKHGVFMTYEHEMYTLTSFISDVTKINTATYI